MYWGDVEDRKGYIGVLQGHLGFRVPVIRIVVFWGLHWGCLILGRYQESSLTMIHLMLVRSMCPVFLRACAGLSHP